MPAFQKGVTDGLHDFRRLLIFFLRTKCHRTLGEGKHGEAEAGKRTSQDGASHGIPTVQEARRFQLVRSHITGIGNRRLYDW